MKKSIMLFIFLAFTFLINVAFAGDAIPGIGVGAGRNPGGSLIAKTKTGNDGKFILKQLKKGRYDLLLSYDEIMKVVNGTDTTQPKKKRYEFTLTFDNKNLNVTVNNKKATSKLTITKDMGAISFTVPQTDTALSGTLEYVIKENVVK